jgi:hypothetical protein
MMRWLPAALLAGLGLVLIVCGCTAAKDEKKGDAFTDPAAAGPDFAKQGEYVGDAGKDKYGAQVIARGDGKFEVFFLKGGLPGEGWDGKTRIHADAKTDADKTTVEGDGWTGVVDGKVIKGKTKDGDDFQLLHTLRESPTLGAKPPDGALVLFDGKNQDHWVYRKDQSPAQWLLRDDGAMQVKPGDKLGDIVSKETFGSCTFHVELRLAFMPKAKEQARSNSGVYVQDRWEIQVLDSFGLTGEDNECGGVYHEFKPLVNMCYPPLSWQTYDVDFTAANYDGGKKVEDAVITVKHNGVVIHDHVKLNKGPTGAGVDEDSAPHPIRLQDHGGDPVSYRNIWVVEKKG